MPTCPIDGCGRTISWRHNMCARHWRQVPRAIKAEVWDSWNSRRRQPREPSVITRHEMAKQAAIAAVHDKQKEKANG